ncbi:kelch repeat-containing protein [Corallococcus terminator]
MPPLQKTLQPLGAARVGHTATLLSDGQVLLLGGKTPSPTPSKSHLKEATVWSPTTGTWTPVKPLGMARANHTATRLGDGRVLVTGGSNPAKGTLASAELWDPKTGKWTATGALSEERNQHTAALLLDGRVMVVGGGSRSAPTEVWDPTTGRWDLCPAPLESRSLHTLTLLPDGRVLMLGGSNRSATTLAASEVWEPATQQWRPVVSLAQAREGHTATLLPDGRILLVGGTCDGFLAQVELLDAALQGTRLLAPLPEGRRNHSATLLPDGRVLLAGGQGEPTSCFAQTFLWSSEDESWLPGTDLEAGRCEHTATLLEDGRVFLAGGYAASPFELRDTAELWGVARVATAPMSSPASTPEAPATQTAKPARSTRAAKKPTAPGYSFDGFAQSVATEAIERLASVLAEGEQVESLRLLHDFLAFWPEQAIAVVEGREVQLEFDPARDGSSIPPNVDERDSVRAALVKRHPSLKKALSLSERNQLPGLLWRLAWHDAAEAISAGLLARGIAVTSRFQVVAHTFEEAGNNSSETSRKELEDLTRGQLRLHFQDDERLRDFAEHCYTQPEKRLWLMRLRDT